MNTLAVVFVLFAEPGFPVVDVDALVAADSFRDTVVAESVSELRAALSPGRVLVWRHGSAFPAEAWGDILRFLERGGSLLYLGGRPFTRAAEGSPGERVLAPYSVSMLKSLRLNQCDVIDAGGARLCGVDASRAGDYPDVAGGADQSTALPASTRVFVLEPRLSDTKDFAWEDGSPGAREGVVHPLRYVCRPDDARFPVGAAALAIDRLRGRFAGGRWVLWLLSTPPDADVLAALKAEAARPAMDVRVDPTFACFRLNERPSVTVRLHRPGDDAPGAAEVALSVTGPDGMVTRIPPITMRGAVHSSAFVELDVPVSAGLCHVSAAVTVSAGSAAGGAASRAAVTRAVTTGFWVFDQALFESGDALTFDGDTMRRAGRPEPVIGTTLMSRGVQRNFLFEPNAAEFDEAFAELASIDVNLVRTGVWSAHRKVSLHPGHVDEAWLRALEAYYLSARRHGVAVVFTFFAFLPEAFGGANPYLDPHAIEGQAALISAVAARFAKAKEMIWDLINEPSFSSPQHLWQCRPVGDAHERAAFLAWLEARFGKAGEAADSGVAAGTCDWESEVRARWRLSPDEAIGLPTQDDFSDRTMFEHHRPYRAADYVRFAQDAFADWSANLVATIRAAGSDAAVTVGQDEGGLTQRPSPQTHARAVAFTSMHTWWANDRLLWDGLMAKAARKPLLVSETGVMNRELLSGVALRRPQDSAALLSRKIGYALAAGAFGVVQWCYDVNPYMASDNEVAIGLRRVDGSYSPEHRVLREFAAFVGRNRARFESPIAPDVVLIDPTGDHYGPRDTATRATQAAVDALSGLGASVRVVPDELVATQLGRPRAMVLPAHCGLSDSAWGAIRRAVRDGAHLICTGWFETDEVGRPAERLGAARRPLCVLEPCLTGDASAAAVDGTGATVLRFENLFVKSWFAAESQAAGWPGTADGGSGKRLHHHPVPLEWAGVSDVLRRFYEKGLRAAGVALHERAPPAGVCVRRVRFADAVLVIAVNESPVARAVLLTESDTLRVQAGFCRLAILDKSGARVIDRMGDAE